MSTEGLQTGIENSNGQIALQVLSNAFPTASTAVKFYYPNPVTYQVFDVTPGWNQNSDNGGFFVSAMGSPVSLTTDIQNSGNQSVTAVGVSGQVFDAALTPVWTNTLTVSALAVGADSMFAYPTTYNPNTVGRFLYQSTTSLASDINPANDITGTEMVVVDTTKPVIGLSYTDTVPVGVLSWQGGTGGGAVYFVPPFYPATLVSTDFFIANKNSKGFRGQISDDDGPNGTHGTVLFEDSLKGASVTANSMNKINITKPIVITSGGIYVAWLMIGDSIALGTDNTSPLSLRNYEIIGGAWGTYRNNSAEDLMIRQNIAQYNFGKITTSTTNDACPSNLTGSATVSVTPGMSPPYTYMWSPGGATTTSITGLAAGSYTCTITDSLNIVKDVVVPVYNNIAVTISSSTDVTCFGGSNGAATVSIGGTAPYTYLWTPGGQTTSAVTGLSAGVYTALATNNDGCTNAVNDTIKTPAVIAATYSLTNSSCVGNDGMINASVTGGTGAYTYAWGTTPVQITATATGLAAGTYSLVISDANGCTSTSSATISNIPFTTAAAQTTSVTCYGGSDGSATGSPTTGGTAPYTYVWATTPAQSAAVATGLSAGVYNVTVTDAKGCTSVSSATISGPAAAMLAHLSGTPATAAGNDGTATATPTGGKAAYTYAWSNGQTFKTIIGLTPGNYTCCITDTKGCTVCDTINIMLDGVNELYSGASIVVSPNPFTTAANVKIDLVNPTHAKLIFTVYDLFGRAVETVDLSTAKGGSIEFVLNRGYNIPGGMYFYRLEDDKKILTTGKLLVQ